MDGVVTCLCHLHVSRPSSAPHPMHGQLIHLTQLRRLPHGFGLAQPLDEVGADNCLDVGTLGISVLDHVYLLVSCSLIKPTPPRPDGWMHR